MDIHVFYDMVGGDYNEVMSRLMKEDRIYKYLGKFLTATEYEDIPRLLDEKNWAEAFRAAHTLKGNSLNLGLNNLADSADEVCNPMRASEEERNAGMQNGVEPREDMAPRLEKLKEDYEATVDAIKELLGQ